MLKYGYSSKFRLNARITWKYINFNSTICDECKTNTCEFTSGAFKNTFYDQLHASRFHTETDRGDKYQL